MRILVVTPTLGTSPWLAETVASVATVCPAAAHVLVAPGVAVAGLQRKFPGVIVLPEPGGGMYAAINAGLAAAEWDAFTYLNDDDLLRPRFTDVVAAVVAAGPDRPLLAYGSVELINHTGARLGTIPVSRFPGHNRRLYAERLEPVYQHGTLVTRAAWRAVGGFDASFARCGDSEYLARLCVQGVPAIHVRGPVGAFRLHPGQFTKDRPAMLAERDRVDAKLDLRNVPPGGRAWARFCFRSGNLGVYAERLARHGWISFDQLLERG